MFKFGRHRFLYTKFLVPPSVLSPAMSRGEDLLEPKSLVYPEF